MKKIFLSTLSKTINTYLGLDPTSSQRLQKLQDKVITIEFLPFHFVFQCSFGKHGAEIKPDALLPAETKISGTPLQMLGVALAKDNRQRFFAEDILIEGNAELGQQVLELFDELHIDWEEHLSHFTGDVPAYHVSQLLRRMNAWLGKTDNLFTQNINEYVHEEIKWLPSREALHDFFNDIDTLRMDIDRMEAKIRYLESEVAQ